MTQQPQVAVGSRQSRVDGRLKVTGGAKYAGEFPTPGLTYGYVISSDIAHGRITRIDTSAGDLSARLTAEGICSEFNK